MVFAIEFAESATNEYLRKQRYVLLEENDYLADQEELVKLRAEVERLSEELGHEQGWISI
jgi:predicted RNA-binding protein with EMAP domain